MKAYKQKVLVVFIVLFLMGLLSDVLQKKVIQDGMISRGENNQEIHLILNVEGVVKEYEYLLDVLSVQPTKEEATENFYQVIQTIDADFQTIKEYVPMQKSYMDGKVKAEWTFLPFGYIDTEGKIRQEKFTSEGEIIQAEVVLSCGAYEEIYQFAFPIFPKEKTKEEEVLQQVEQYLESQMMQEGSTKVQLPTQIGETTLDWSEQKEFITPQIVLLEVAMMLLFLVISKRKEMQEKKLRLDQMEHEYPDLVNQLALLLGAGMTTRQAWNRLSLQYEYKRKVLNIKQSEVSEAVLRMNRRFLEGESERGIYQQFIQEVNAPCYRKLMRILLANLEKGTQGIANYLQEESRLAYEERVIRAKRLGEEASTKMLLPLMLMLVIVMGIVIIPALMEFKI